MEKHLGRSVKVGISSSIEVPRALNAGEVLLLIQAGQQGLQELAKLVQIFQGSSNGSADSRGHRSGR